MRKLKHRILIVDDFKMYKPNLSKEFSWTYRNMPFTKDYLKGQICGAVTNLLYKLKNEFLSNVIIHL